MCDEKAAPDGELGTDAGALPIVAAPQLGDIITLDARLEKRLGLKGPLVVTLVVSSGAD